MHGWASNKELAFKLMKILRLAGKGYSSSCVVHLAAEYISMTMFFALC